MEAGLKYWITGSAEFHSFDPIVDSVAVCNEVIYNAFSRSFVSQNETKVNFFSIKENRAMVNNLISELIGAVGKGFAQCY